MVLRSLLTLLLLATTAAANTTPPDRKTVALALGGGASRGFAHIGVLEWLDEHRIPVDAIAGTSIGALVGGAYAAGLSAEEIKGIVEVNTLLRVFDWDDPHAARDYRDKIDARTLPGAALLPFVGNPPRGLNAGHALWLLFSRMTYPVSDVDTFDDLPIPFRAIAVDLLTVEERVFADGNLATAMRSSMSVPLAFHPPEVDGSLMIDGGARNVVPADVARGMGADVVIAVDVSPGLKTLDDFAGANGVLGQAATAPVRASILRTRGDADVFVRPAVDGYEPGDFEEFAVLIDIGYDAMEALDVDLSHLQLSESDYAAWRATLAERRTMAESNVVDFVEVDVDDPWRRDMIERQLADLVGAPLDFDALERRLTRLKARGRFYALYYERMRRGRQEGLRILSYDREQPAVLEAQLGVFATELDASGLSLNLRYAQFDMLRRDDEWQTDLRLGDRFDLRSEFYLPVAGPAFVALHAGFQQDERRVFDEDERIGEFRRRRATGGFDVGLGRGWRTQEWRAGIEFDRASIDGVPTDDVTNGATAKLGFGVDLTDRETLPSRGVRGTVLARHGFHRSFTDEDVDQIEARAAAWLPVGRHALVARAEVGLTLDGDAPDAESFVLGGPFRLGALPVDARRGSNAELFALGWQHALGADSPFANTRLLVMVETGAVHGDGEDPVFTTNVSANYVTETPVGHLVVGIAASDDDVRGYVTFGWVAF